MLSFGSKTTTMAWALKQWKISRDERNKVIIIILKEQNMYAGTEKIRNKQDNGNNMSVISNKKKF